MNIPPFWAKARYEAQDSCGLMDSVAASGWSFASMREAKEKALERAKRAFEIVSRGKKPERHAYDDYLDLPVKEEIVKEIADGGSRIAVITRNRYGALVLNSPNALFVDVDFPPPKPVGLFEGLALLFSTKKREERRTARAEEATGKVRQWAESNPGRSFRLYRTKEGLRLLFTGKLFEPASGETASILSGLGADPLYVKLTQKQECFRARLTSKPWRCGSLKPPNSFPWESPAEEKAYRQWEEAYTRLDGKFKVCELVEEFGGPCDVAELKNIVDIHDRGTRVEADAELA